MMTGNTQYPVRVLICEDEPTLRADLAAVLCEAGYAVIEAADGMAARALLARVVKAWARAIATGAPLPG